MGAQYSRGDLRPACIKNMASIDTNINTGINESIIVNGVDNTDLPNTFNSFFSCFERSAFLENISACKNSLEPRNDPRNCADQLRGVFSKLFQMCADLGHIPTIWKTSTIKPIPKTKDSKELRDFRTVSLTSLIMKIVEKILNIIVSSITGKLDPLQFAY